MILVFMNISERIYKQICIQLQAIKPFLDIQVLRKICNIIFLLNSFSMRYLGCQLEIAYANINRFMLRASSENERIMSRLHCLTLEKLE